MWDYVFIYIYNYMVCSCFFGMFRWISKKIALPDQRISAQAERENSLTEVGFWIWTLGFDPAKSRFKFIDHMGVSFLWGPQIIHFSNFSRIFHYEPSSYWGIPISGGPHFSHKNSAVSWGDSPETPRSCSHWDPWVFAPDVAPTCLI